VGIYFYLEKQRWCCSVTNRPKLKVQKTKTEKLHDYISITVFVVIITYLFLMWARLPAIFPTHFNGRGEVNGWGGKASLLLVPIISLVIYIGLTVLAKYPHSFNYPREITDKDAYPQYSNARLMISWMKLELTILFGYIEWNVIHAAFGHNVVLWILPLVLVAIIGTIIFYALRSMRIN
jgi:uncharacterized membrane protein